MGKNSRLAAIVAPEVERAGLYLEDLEVRLSPRARGRIRVVVDLPEDETGGVDADRLGEVSAAISAALEEADDLSDPYDLEVTSPGVGRPLTQPRHWRRARTRMVQAHLSDGQTIQGRVLDADADRVVLQTADTPRTLSYSELDHGTVVVELNRSGR